MLEIEVNKKKILLTGKAKIKLTYRNYNFEDAFANKVVSMPFEAPLHGINLEIFGFENIPNFETFFNDGSATIFYKSIPFLQGKIQILSNDRKTIKLSFFEETNFVDLPDINLNEINLGGNRTLAVDVPSLLTFAKDNLALNYPSTDFNFPTIYNPKFIDESVTEFSKVMNRFGTRFGDFFPQNSIDLPRADCLVPQPFLMYIIKQIFAEIGFTIAGDFVTDADANKLMIYANHALDSKEVITLNPEDAKATLTADTSPLDSDYFTSKTYPAEEAEIDLPFIPGEIALTTFNIIFDNDSTSGNFDNGGFYDHTKGTFKITTTKKHTITYTIIIDRLFFDGAIANDAANTDLFNFYIFSYVNKNTNVDQATNSTEADYNSIIESEFFVEKLKADFYTEVDGSLHYTITKTFEFTPDETDIDKYLSVWYSVWRLYTDPLEDDLKKFKLVDAKVKATSSWQIDVDPDVYNLNSYNPVYNMQNSVPIVKCKDFMKEIKNTFNLAFVWDYENKICYINYFDNILQNADFVNYSNKAEFNFDKKQKSFTINGLKYLIPEKDIAAEQLTLAQKEYNVEQATNVIALNATPLGYCFTGYARQGGGFCLVPWIEESGNSGFDGTTTNNRQNVRLMFWRGLSTNTIGQQYPKALSYNMDISGAPTGEATLTLDGPTGIVQKYYANYMQRFNNSAEFNRRFLLNIIDIKNLNTNDTWLVDYGKYTLKQLDVEIGENIEPAEATLLKID